MNTEQVLKAMRANTDSEGTQEGWRMVYLDNALPQDREFRRSLGGMLSSLTKRGVYKEVDGFAWGQVKMTD